MIFLGVLHVKILQIFIYTKSITIPLVISLSFYVLEVLSAFCLFVCLQDASGSSTPKVPRFLNPLVLTSEQKRVLQVVQSGLNVFFTGKINFVCVLPLPFSVDN